jgi:uncharacterized protein DUF3631
VPDFSLRSSDGTEEPIESSGVRKDMKEIKTVYPYRDEEGELLYEQNRFEPKSFAFCRPIKGGGRIWNLKDTRLVLYNLPEVIEADEVGITEGEKDVESLKSLGLPATCNPGGAGKWRPEYSKCLKGKEVYVLQDNDEPGRKHALAVAHSVAKFASKVILVPPFRRAKDVTEWIEHGGTKKKLEKLIAGTEPFEREIALLDTPAADDDPTNSASDWRGKSIRGKWAVCLPETLFVDYLVLPKGIPFVASLWVIATHIHELFDCFPYLTVTSPTKRCGKTRFAEILELLCARPLMSVNISEAALFRSIENEKPTVIIDEAETLRNRESERAQYLLSILQAGFRQGAYVLRCVGKDFAVKKFPVFCPKAILAIGNLPDTLMDRSVVISMRRHLQSERVARFRRRQASEQAAGIVRTITAWAEKNKKNVARAYSKQNLDFLKDREADLWEPLFAVASVAVPDRLEELTAIAKQLSDEKSGLDVDDSQGIRMLADIRTLLSEAEHRRMSTAKLLVQLREELDGHWDDKLTAVKLARILRPFQVSSKQLWIGKTNARGYEYEDFEPVFKRYLPPKVARPARTSEIKRI